MRILFVPSNNWMTHPNPMRHHFLFKHLAQVFGCKVFVLGFRGLGKSSYVINRDLVTDDNIQVIEEHAISYRHPAVYYVLNAGSAWRSIERALKSLRIDVIVHSNLIPSVAVATLAKRSSPQVPVVYDCIEYYPESACAYYTNPATKALVYQFTKRIMEYLIRTSDVVITVCDSHARMVRKIAPTKPVRVVPNGVDLEQFSSTDDNTCSEHSGSSGLDMIYVGSVDEWLDLETVVEAMSNLKETGFRTRLTVVGGSHGGNYLKRLSSQIASSDLKEQVVFTGFVPHHFVPGYINRADVALAPYKKVLKNDGTPLKISEYLACQKIVLSTRIPEISRRFGRFVNFYDGVDDLTRLLKEITVNRAAFANKMEGARNFLSEYSWASLASKYYEILRSVTCS